MFYLHVLQLLALRDKTNLKSRIAEKRREYENSLQSDIITALEQMKTSPNKINYLTVDKFVIRMIQVDLGIEMNDTPSQTGNKINPFTNIYFYDKQSTEAKEIDWKNVPLFQIPE